MPCPLRPHLSTRPLLRAVTKGFVLVLPAALAACAAIGPEPASRSPAQSYRSQQSPEQAARCFGRNAEEHSSALTSEVTVQENRASVVVSVRNGVTYATADFKRAGSGSLGTINLNVVTSGNQRELVASLTEGC